MLTEQALKEALQAADKEAPAILLGEAIPSGQPGAVQHTGKMPFAFWEVIPETSPRAQGTTTRTASACAARPILTSLEPDHA